MGVYPGAVSRRAPLGAAVDPSGPAGLWSKLRRGHGDDDWERELADEVARVTVGQPAEVRLLISALQTELGRRLQTAAQLMRDRGYRLHMVTPEEGMTWTAGFERVDS